MRSELSADGNVIVSTLAEPAAGFARAVARRRALTVVVISTAISLAAAALILPRINAEAIAGDALRPDMTPHERLQAMETATKLYEVKTWAEAALGPVSSALALACVLWVAFRVAGARPGFKATFTVTAHALVPSALRALLTVPAVMAHAPVNPNELSQLLPSSVTAWLPGSVHWPGPALAAAGALDLFTLWSVVLLGSGMKTAAGASRLRTWLVMAVLFASYVAVFKVVAAHFSPGGAP